MKILILGGTGAMGMHLVECFKNTKIEVFVTSRKSRNSEQNVKYVKGNAKDFNFLQDLLTDKWDAIVDFMVYNTITFKKHIDLILNATSHYLFLSSSRVYADTKDEPINESSARLLDVSDDENYLLTDNYALTKARQEDILKESKKLNWTIIRPYITYSENKFQLGVFEKEDWLYRALKGRTIVFSYEISLKLTTLTYGFDVAKGIFNTIGNSDAKGRVFNITTNESKTWSEILNIYLNVLENFLGKRPKYKLLKFPEFLSIHSEKYQIQYDRIYNRKFDNSRISNLVEVDNFKKVDEGLETCLKEFLQKPNFNTIDWRKEAIKDRQTNEKASLKEIENFKNKIKYLVYRYFVK